MNRTEDRIKLVKQMLKLAKQTSEVLGMSEADALLMIAKAITGEE